jgi:hypothetical protein
MARGNQLTDGWGQIGLKPSDLIFSAFLLPLFSFSPILSSFSSLSLDLLSGQHNAGGQGHSVK